MISQVPEKQMHTVRWLLAIGWLTLIFSLLYDPISILLTDPNNLNSPFRIHPEIANSLERCVKIQGVCVPRQGEIYGMGARIFWPIVLPIGIFVLLVFGHEFWRRICPLYFFSQIPRALKFQRQRQVVNPDTGSVRYELAGVEKESWLGRNYLYLQIALFYIGLNIRLLFANGDRTAMAIFLSFTILSAIAVGYLFKGRSWCQYFCPMAPVQMFYTGTQGLFGTDAHLSPPQSITQSMCRTVDSSGKEKSACVSCQSPCFDIDAERSYWEGITRQDQKVLFYSYFGLMLGFYFYFFLYSGNWNYYYSGVWTHEPELLKTLFSPGFYIFGYTIPIPKLIAAPLTLGVFGIVSYFVCESLEKAFRSYLKWKNKHLREEQILHICFASCTFISFNVFFLFGGRPTLFLLPSWTILIINGLFVLVSTLWFAKSLSRSKERYSRESLADNLRRQLNKLAVDWSRILEGRSLKELLPDEVYVLAKVLPGFKRTDRLTVYKGVLQEALEDGKVHSANSLKVLRDIRKELNVNDEEHYTLLKELGVENPDIFNTQIQRQREDTLRIDGYKGALEFLLFDLVAGRVSLQEAFKRKQKQILALRQEYAITADEQEQVLAQMFNQDSPMLRKAEILLAQLQRSAVCIQALNNLVSHLQTPVYTFLQKAVLENQKLITNQLLSIIEILGDTPEAMSIANITGVLAAKIIPEILRSHEEQAKWPERLGSQAIALLQQTEDATTRFNLEVTTLGSGSETRLNLPVTQLGSGSETRLNLPVTQFDSGSEPTRLSFPTNSDTDLLQPNAINDILLELLHDLDPVIQAASLYALNQQNSALGKKEAQQLLNFNPNPDWLVKETVAGILNQHQQTPVKIPTFTAQIGAMGRTQRKVFQQPIIRVGRSQDNDIVIPDHRISRHHAIFYLDGQGVSVKDLGSANGLRIDNETISDGQKQLQPGNIVRFSTGDDILILVQWEMQSATADPNKETLGTLEKLLWLYQSSFFQGLQANALIELARNANVRVYHPGEKIYQMGDPAKDLLVLIDGQAQMHLDVAGKEQSIVTVAVGQTIGELEVLSNSQRTATLVATGVRTRVLAIDSQNFAAVLSLDPLLAKNLLVLVSSRLQKIFNQPVAT